MSSVSGAFARRVWPIAMVQTCALHLIRIGDVALR
jgi:hypothetical protein